MEWLVKTKILLHNTEKGKPRFEVSQAKRPYAILLAISNGNFRVSFPESKQTYIFSPYEISYIPPNTQFYKEVINPIDFHQFAFEFLDTEHPFGELKAGKLSIPKEQVKAILDSADMISQFYNESAWLSENILHRILADGYLFSQKNAKSHLSNEILLAIEYIECHLNETFSIAELAQKLHLSHNGLIWKFKQELNITPQKYIATCRIILAKQLLLEDALSLSQIAEKCGYANAYYFSNAFKKAEGICPSAFRGRYIK